MRLRRIMVALAVAALGLGACGGDSEDAGIAVEEPIGAPEPDPALETTPSVAKTARIELEVARGRVADAAQAAVDLATSPKIDGYLTSSVIDLEDGHGSAVVLVHVPVDRFEQAVADLGGIGEITRQEMAGRQLAEPGMTRKERAAIAAEVAYAPVDVAIAGRPAAPPPQDSPIEQALGTATDIALAIASGAIVAAGAVVPAGLVVVAVWLVCTLVVRRLRPRWEQPG